MADDIEEKHDELGFSVDAGIINRLGIELVGRSETAVSELIKNSYDADATKVDVLFRDTNRIGGTLVIEDNGEGMNFNDLKNGFMRLSSTDKIHNPISSKFNRKKAGKKGIGRFSTQRLGTRLVIITKKTEMPLALELIINWDTYKIDTDLSKIKNKVSYVKPPFEKGTKLIIEGLRDIWGNVEIRRVYRYISNLLQPDFLSERASTLNIASKENEDNSFNVYCSRFNESDEAPVEIGAPEKLILNKAIATIEGYVDQDKSGFCKISSSKFEISSDIIPISGGKNDILVEKFNYLRNVNFKVYYFIYNRPEYYDFDNNFTQLELNSIQKLAEEASGIKLYRNGFRVFPYGETGSDWLNIDRKLSKVRGDINIPFDNKNLFGFIEIIDKGDSSEEIFEETASREGLIENTAFRELQDFVFKTLNVGMLRIASAEEFVKAKKEREKKRKSPFNPNSEERLSTIRAEINNLQDKISSNHPDKDQYVSAFLMKLPKQIEDAKEDIQEQIRENGMLRVLAGIGLVIGEFVHEIEQFDTIFKSKIKFLRRKIVDSFILGKVIELEEAFTNYQSYTGYFRISVSQNVKREIAPINLKTTVNAFVNQVESNSKKANIEINKIYEDQYLITCPMHPSEWLSILFNLYTNSKKAIQRSSKKPGKIAIRVYRFENKIHLDFCDNGGGISESIVDKIFTPFYTTSNPLNPDEKDINDNSGTGLGLYIVKKIINSYSGTIEIATPFTAEYNTCFKIILPSK